MKLPHIGQQRGVIGRQSTHATQQPQINVYQSQHVPADPSMNSDEPRKGGILGIKANLAQSRSTAARKAALQMMQLDKPIEVVKYSEQADNRDTFLLNIKPAQNLNQSTEDKIMMSNDAASLLMGLEGDRNNLKTSETVLQKRVP